MAQRHSDAHMRETPARRKVLAVFSASRKPLSAKEVAAKIAGSDTVTVYRTIDTLVKAGKVKRVDLGGRAALYETASRHHHHIVCVSCGKIEDFEGCTVSVAQEKILSHSKHFSKITDHSFELFGICGSCDTK